MGFSPRRLAPSDQACIRARRIRPRQDACTPASCPAFRMRDAGSRPLGNPPAAQHAGRRRPGRSSMCRPRIRARASETARSYRRQRESRRRRECEPCPRVHLRQAPARASRAPRRRFRAQSRAQRIYPWQNACVLHARRGARPGSLPGERHLIPITTSGRRPARARNYAPRNPLFSRHCSCCARARTDARLLPASQRPVAYTTHPPDARRDVRASCRRTL